MNYIIFFAFLYVSYLKFCSSFKFHLIFRIRTILSMIISVSYTHLTLPTILLV